MTWVVEEPLYIVILGVLTMAVLGFGWMQTRFRGLLYGILGVGVLTVTMLLVESWVKTDSEEIEELLAELATYVERNDADTVLAHFHSQAAEIRNQAESEFQNYEFESVDVRRIVSILIDPPKAVATFRVYASGSRRKANASSIAPRRGSVNLELEVTFLKEAGQWRILAYRRDNPLLNMKIN